MAGTTSESLSGARRAAILMVLLGEQAAAPLLKKLDPAAVAAIALELSQLGEIEPDVAQRVLEHYFIDAVRPTRERGGTEVARRLLDRADIPHDMQRRWLGAESDPSGELLRPLLETTPEMLAAALGGEHPQTTALILLHLGPTKAARVLHRLPEGSRPEALTRMLSLRKVRGEILGEVASSLRDRLRDTVAVEPEEADDGVERTASVLRAMPRAEMRSLLEQIEAQEPERAAKLRELVDTFPNLLAADGRGIQELLRTVETKTLALALHGEEPALVDHFLGNLSERAATMFREELEFLKNVREQDKHEAQQEIMKQALQLEREEKLFFRLSTEGEEG